MRFIHQVVALSAVALCALLMHGAAWSAPNAGEAAAKSFFNWAALTHFETDNARLMALAMVIAFLVFCIWQGRGIWRKWLDFRAAKKTAVSTPTEAHGEAVRLVETASRKGGFPERRKNTDNLEFMLRLLKEVLGDGNGTKGRLEKMIEGLRDEVKEIRTEQDLIQRQMCLGHRVHMLLFSAIKEIQGKMGLEPIEMPTEFDKLCEKCGLKFTEKEKND